MARQALYKELAHCYDLLYSYKDYKEDYKKIIPLIKKYKLSKGNALLDVGCGTGSHLSFFSKRFSCTGMDLNKEMIAIARKKIKSVQFLQGNMNNFLLGKEFDVILCLFSSIGYVKTYSGLKRTAYLFAKHLKRGGVLIIEPWFSDVEFIDGMPHMVTYDGKDLKIARLNVSKKRNGVSILDFNFLVAEKGKGVRHILDRHELGLFEKERTLEILKDSGLKARYLNKGLPEGRGLFVAVKK